MTGKLNIDQAAEFLGISVKTLRNWMGDHDPKRSRPRVRSYKCLGRVWFDRKDLEQLRKSLVEVRAG